MAATHDRNGAWPGRVSSGPAKGRYLAPWLTELPRATISMRLSMMTTYGSHAHGRRELNQVATRALPTLPTALSGVVAAISGIAPHALHHAAPIGGTALVSGATGTLVFGIVGFILSIPMLLRLRRRFDTWAGPAFATALFTAVYVFSALVLAPAVTGTH